MSERSSEGTLQILMKSTLSLVEATESNMFKRSFQLIQRSSPPKKVTNKLQVQHLFDTFCSSLMIVLFMEPEKMMASKIISFSRAPYFQVNHVSFCG